MYICKLCMDYGKMQDFKAPQKLSEHVEKFHRWEVGAFLQRHIKEIPPAEV